MEQYQKAVTETSFVSEQSIERFFKIQNQTRDIEYLSVKLQAVTTMPTAEELDAYYQQQIAAFQTAEQVYIALDKFLVPHNDYRTFLPAIGIVLQPP
jgi:peptidyl-prolyl cis-trans isomerase D